MGRSGAARSRCNTTGAEQRVAVQYQEIALHLAARNPAAHEIVGDRVERVVQRADLLRAVTLRNAAFDELRTETDDDRDVVDAAREERIDLPADERLAGRPAACIWERAR
jgi:hypothetical protein